MSFKNKFEQVKEQGVVFFKQSKEITAVMIDKTKEKLDGEVERRKDIANQRKLDEEDRREEQKKLREIFIPDKILGNIEVDVVNKLFIINNARIKEESLLKKATGLASLIINYGEDDRVEDIFKFDDLIEYELIEDGVRLFDGNGNIEELEMIKNRKLKRVIGSFVLNIKLSDSQYGSLVIPYTTKSIKTSEDTYLFFEKMAYETLLCLDMIVSQNKQDKLIKDKHKQQSKPITKDVLDELKKLKELLEVEIITQEEFEVKKKETLGL